MGKVLVVGANSKVGTELVRMLTAAGETVKAATRRPYEYRAAPGVEVTGFDYDVNESVKPALADVDRVFMLNKWTELHPELALNRFIEHALVANVGHIVYMTGTGVDKQPAVGLTLVEKHLAKSGLGYTILRPNWLMQNFSRGFLHERLRELGLIVVPAGTAKVSFVDARDVAAVAQAALNDPAHAGQEYTLTGGQALSFDDVATTLENTLGRRVRYQPADDEEFRSILASGWEPAQAAYLAGLFRYVREQDVAAVDPTLGTLLGRAPTSFEQFAQDHAAVWQ